MTEFTFPTNPMEVCNCLYGSECYFSRCVGYCGFHKAYLTAKQLKTKNCLGKQCDALIKQTAHPFWVNRSQHKLDKKLKKEEAASKLHLVEKKPIISNKKTAPVKKQYICLDLEMNDLTSKERKSAKGLSAEVIQIGAVMLDENCNCISQFNAYVKPVYGSVTEEITQITGITDAALAGADTFSTAFYKLYSWAGKEDVTTFCWSDSDYKQLWDEIFIKARNHDEYRTFLKTFVDLQSGICSLVKAEKPLSLDAAMKLCHLKFTGQRHSAFADAFNTARILNKVYELKNFIKYLPKVATYAETGLSKRFESNITKDKDFTSSFASFVDPELLQKLGYKKLAEDEKKIESHVKKQNRITKLLSKKVMCLKYDAEPSAWFKFSIKMMFKKDMKTANGK